MQEIWKDIKNFEGCYQVSNLGRIKSLPKEYIMPNGSIGIRKEKMEDNMYSKYIFVIIKMKKVSGIIKFFILTDWLQKHF